MKNYSVAECTLLVSVVSISCCCLLFWICQSLAYTAENESDSINTSQTRVGKTAQGCDIWVLQKEKQVAYEILACDENTKARMNRAAML